MLLAVAVTASFAGVGSELTVIHDSGNTQSLTPLLNETLGRRPNQTPVPPPPVKNLYNPNQRFPVITPGVQPGTVAWKPLPTALTVQPFFVIGDDDLSLQWLEQRYDALVKLGAVGWLVNVRDRQRFEQLRDFAGDLMLVTQPATNLVEQFGLTRYPVLVTNGGIEQ